MSKAKVTPIKAREQAPQTVPLLNVRIQWMAEDWSGNNAKTRTIDGVTLARLLYAAPETRNNTSQEYLGMHLNALQALTAALSECDFKADGTEAPPPIFWALSEYLRWLKMEEHWASPDRVMGVLRSARVTIGAAAEEGGA